MNGFSEHERRFDLFGSRVRLLIGEPLSEDLPGAAAVAMQIEGLMRTMHRALTRFEPDSELSRLNAEASPDRAASPLLRRAIRSGIWAAEASGGLVDPTVLDDLERAGYTTSLAGVKPPSLASAVAAGPPRRAAAARDDAAWGRIEIDDEAGSIRVPAGTRMDTGGTAKGLAADLAAERLRGYASFAIDVGGDIRIGGDRPSARRVDVTHPLRQGSALSFGLAAGAVATSGLATRLWETPEGFAHHLIDPSRGVPAWTGIIQATVVATTALEAETLAKAALLAGPVNARRELGASPAILIADDGGVTRLGRLEAWRAEAAGAPA